MRKITLLLFIISFFNQKIIGQIELGVPQTTIFTTKDFNGEAQSFDFIQDEKGNLLVANTYGFLKYNGITWESFRPKDESIPVSFCKTPKGEIFAGGVGLIGLIKTKSNGETYFESYKNKLPEDFILGIVWDIFYKENKIYFRNDNNVLVYDYKTFKIIKSENGINNLFQHNNDIYFNNKTGIYKIINDKAILLKDSKKLAKHNIRNIISTNEYSTLIVTLKDGIFELKNDFIRRIESKISNFLKEKLVYTAKTLNDGTILFSMVKGGVLFTDNNFNPIFRLSTKCGLSDNSVKKILQDNTGNLWIGTDQGITKIKYPITTTFYNHNKDNIGTVEEITSHDNKVFIGTSTGTYQLKTISEKDLLKDDHFAVFEHLPNDDVENFANYSLSNKFLFSGYRGVHEYKNNKTKTINQFNARKFYKSIYHKNILYLGHAYGCEILFLNDNNDIISTKKITDLREIRGIAEDSENNLWLTSVSDGVYQVSFSDNFENIKLKKYTTEDGLPSLRDNLVYNINDKEVVFTTFKGLYKFDFNKNKFVPENRFGEKYSGGQNEFVYALNFDKNQEIWLHSFRKKIAGAYIKDSLNNYQLLETPLLDIGDKQIYEILSEPDKNVVWFGGAEGLARFDRSKILKKRNSLFNAVISKVKGVKDSLLIMGSSFDKSIKNTFKPRMKDLRFEVGVTDFTFLDKNRFQYKLEGYNEEWSDWTSEPFKIYTNLSQGDYTFKVRAKNYANQISKEDYYAFSILPFWYQKDWFRVLAFFVVAFILIYIANYFSKRKFVKKVYQLELAQKYENEKNEAILKEKERGLQAMISAQEEERSKIARELHDGVVQQIGSVILKSRNLFKNKEFKEDKAAKEVLESLENSNQDLRNISHQMMPRALKELGILPALQDLLDGSLGYTEIKSSLESFNLEDRLPEKIEVTIYRITQELINNIIKHSKATQVSVQLFKNENNIILIVEDNGVGFSSKTSKKGIGLLNISSRLDMVKGNVNFEPSPDSGTLVTINIPL